MKELEQAAKDLNSPIKDKREAAQKKLDKESVKRRGSRKDLERLQRIYWRTPPTRTSVRQKKKVDEARRTPESGPEEHTKASAQKELDEAVKSQQSRQGQAKAAPKNKLDKTVGEDKRRNGAAPEHPNSPDKKTRKLPQKKLQEMKDKMKDGVTGNQQPEKNNKPLTEEQKKELQEAAKNLNSPDEKKRKDAQAR